MASKPNEFKAPRKLASGERGDVRSHCEMFKMTAANEEDMEFLAHLYRTIWLTGGTVRIDDGEEAETYHFERW